MLRYNLFPAAEVKGDAAPGRQLGQALAVMESSPRAELPHGITFEWTDLAYQESQGRQHRRTTSSRSAVVFVFLALAAQYESWSLPLAIILIVPMCLLAAHRSACWLRGARTTTSSPRSASSC